MTTELEHLNSDDTTGVSFGMFTVYYPNVLHIYIYMTVPTIKLGTHKYMPIHNLYTCILH